MTKHENLIVIIGVLIVALVCILSIVYVNNAKSQFMHKSIESAIAKGIDPLAVRCSYSDSEDLVCVVYAATHRNDADAPKIPQKSSR